MQNDVSSVWFVLLHSTAVHGYVQCLINSTLDTLSPENSSFISPCSFVRKFYPFGLDCNRATTRGRPTHTPHTHHTHTTGAFSWLPCSRQEIGRLCA